MHRSEPARSFLRRALGISTALHLLALPLLLLLLAAPSATDLTTFTVERETVSVERISIERRAVAVNPAASKHAALAPAASHAPRSGAPPAAPHVAVAPRHARAAARVVAMRPVSKRIDPHATASAPDASTASASQHRDIALLTPRDPRATSAASAASAASGVSAAQPVPAAAAGGIALATATPSAAPQATATPPGAELAHEASAHDPSARGAEAVPVGGWGQSFEKPMIADDGALADLRKRYHATTPIAVAVDENGRAVRVVIPASMPAELRDALERELLALRYVPAECNGLRCTGTVDVTL